MTGKKKPRRALPAPFLVPSTDDSVRYEDVKNKLLYLVIEPFDGMKIGQKIHWKIKGHGSFVGSEDVEAVEKLSIRAWGAIGVFFRPTVSVSYDVESKDAPFESEVHTYAVIGAPFKRHKHSLFTGEQ